MYEDSIGGWKVDLPESWYVAPADDVAGERTLTISNDALPVESDTFEGPDPATFPSDLVVLEITRLVGRPPHDAARDDTTFPLDPDLLRNPFQTTEAPVVAFQGNGLAYRARLFVGDEASDDVVIAMLDVVRSFRFPAREWHRVPRMDVARESPGLSDGTWHGDGRKPFGGDLRGAGNGGPT